MLRGGRVVGTPDHDADRHPLTVDEDLARRAVRESELLESRGFIPFGLGAGWAALDRAIPYSTERIQAGSPLSEKQGYTHKLIVPHAVRLEAARAYIEETAQALDVSLATVERDWRFARAWLLGKLGDAVEKGDDQSG